MKIIYKKLPTPEPSRPGAYPDTSPRYEIRMQIRGCAEEEAYHVVLGTLYRGSWGRGSSDHRWEFKGLENGAPHPLCNQYPDTLSEAKSLVSEWVAAVMLGQLDDAVPLPPKFPYRCNHVFDSSTYVESDPS